VSRDDEDRWIERTVSDADFADAVWSGSASDDAPSWYPDLVRVLDAARNPPAPDYVELSRGREAWSEVAHRARRRRWVVAAAAVAVMALTAGGAAAAMDKRVVQAPVHGVHPGGGLRGRSR
jgi:hypothetical protein